MKKQTGIMVVGLVAIVGVAAYIYFNKNSPQNAVNTLASQQVGATSGQPQQQYPYSVAQPERSDTNSSLNNQPWTNVLLAQSQQGNTLASIANSMQAVSQTVTSAKDIYNSIDSLFGSNGNSWVSYEEYFS